MRVLILGAGGQDGSYLAEQLLAAGDDVYGMVHIRPMPQQGPGAGADRFPYVIPGVQYLPGEMNSYHLLRDLIIDVNPDVVYNLAARTTPGMSWSDGDAGSESTDITKVTGLGVLRVLEICHRHTPHTRIVQAGSAAVFDPTHPVQDETTPIRPATLYGPYGAAKALAHMAVAGHRDGYGAHASTAILFSHTSPRQDPRFLARRITRTVAQIAAGTTTTLPLGSADTRRDWGYAPDFVRALPLIAAQDTPGDYVIATGTTHSVANFAWTALAAAGLDPGDHIRIDPTLIHPHDIGRIRGDATKAQQVLGWEPEVTFHTMVNRMVNAESRDPVPR